MSVYNLDKLMDETRRLAAEYRRSTGGVLPVSGELARYDAIRLLGLATQADSTKQADKYQIKSRVVFDKKKGGQRVGQLNLDGDWSSTLLVLMDADYQPTEIFELTRTALEAAIPDMQELKKSARGSMSVKKFKAISELRWCRDDHSVRSR